MLLSNKSTSAGLTRYPCCMAVSAPLSAPVCLYQMFSLGLVRTERSASSSRGHDGLDELARCKFIGDRVILRPATLQSGLKQ